MSERYLLKKNIKMKCNTIKIFCLRKVVDKRIINKR
jgi:hypothetical protein